MASVDQLWLTDFGEPQQGEPANIQPALVVGPPQIFGTGFPFVIVTPLTTTNRGLSLHIEIEPTRLTGLDEISYVQCELIRSINRNRLQRQIGVVDHLVSTQVSEVLRTLLDL